MYFLAAYAIFTRKTYNFGAGGKQSTNNDVQQTELGILRPTAAVMTMNLKKGPAQVTKSW